jgi:iron complex outermembrane receptor protein
MVFQRKKIASALTYALGAGSATLVAMPAMAQDVRVEVTGSAIRRVDAEASLPVTIISREEIARTGVTTAEQLLLQIPQIDTLGATAIASGAGLSTYGQASVSLRGLGSTRTLVLLNGRRLASFAGDDGSVNVNSIPIAAIERVEVLRDGASAIYGSDAVAGVINFITRQDYQGVEVGGQYGTPTRDGGGQSWNVYAIGGIGDLAKDKFNVNMAIAYNKESTLFGRDRDFANTAIRLPYFSGAATGQGNIEGAWNPGTGSAANGTWVEGTRVPGFTSASPASGYGNPLAASNQCANIRMFKNPTNTSKGTPYCTYDSAPDVNLVPQTERFNANVNLNWMITKDVQLFADAMYANQIVTSTIQPSPVRRSFLLTDSLFQEQGVDPVLLIKPSNPNYQIAANFLNANGFSSLVGKPLAVSARVFDFGPRQTTDEATQWRALVGLKGTAWNQDWEVAYYHNVSDVAGRVTSGYFSQVAYAKIVQGSNDWNPWSLVQSPAFTAQLPAAIYLGPTLNATATNDNVDAKISGEVWKLPAGPMQYALGFNWSDSSIKLDPAPALFSGDIAGLGGSIVPLDQSRRVTAVYGQLDIPIVQSLDGTLAIRYDDYSDFGGTTNYFASLRWQPVKNLLLRASYGTGFRAPTLSDLYYPVTLGTSAQFNDPVTGENDLQVNEYTGGNSALQPETSTQWGVGVLWQPIKQFSIGVDYFNIKLEDIIATPSTQEVVSGNATGNPAYAGKVVRGADGAIETVTSQTVNVGSAKVEGYDFTANWTDTYSWGTPSIGYVGTYMTKFDQTSPGGVLVPKVGTIVDVDCNPVLDSDSGGVIPRYKHDLQFGYNYGPWQATLIQHYYSSYQTGCRLDGERNYTGAQQIWDLQFAWTGIKNFRVGLGIKNLFDKDPPIFIPVSNQFQNGYDISMYDPRSRFIYGQMSYKFY